MKSEKKNNQAVSEIKRLYRTLRSLVLGKCILAVWNLTERCNYQCLFCNVPSDRAKDPSLAEIEETSQRLKELGIQYVYLQGGEPLLREDISQVLSAVLARGLKPVLITNASLLSYDLIDFIKDRDINLSVSLQALDPALHQTLTGYDSPGKILRFLESLKDIERKGNWSITTTVTRLNYREVEKIERFAARNNFMYAMRCYMDDLGDFSKHNPKLCFDGQKDEVIDLFERFKKKEYRRNYFTHLIYREEVEFLKGNCRNGCDAGKYSILVNSDGSISPCLEKPKLSIKAPARETALFLKSEEVRRIIKDCSENTPCFHGCARNIGILAHNKLRLTINLYRSQVRKYLSFF